MKNQKNISLPKNQQDLVILCKFCRRKLKNPIYTALGYGLCCAKKNGLIISIVKKHKIKKQESANLFEVL